VPAVVALRQHPVFRWVTAVLVVAVFLYFFPLFHVVSLKEVQQQIAAGEFDAAEYVDSIWNGALQDRLHDAVDANDLLAAFANDLEGTAEQHGHRLGLSGHSSYLVSGQGQIIAMDDFSVSIALQEEGPAAIVIETGPVFGNAIRDGSGLLNVSDFDNAQDFNALSAEINRRVEEEVLPELNDKASLGAMVRFVGGVEVSDMAGAPDALVLVPVKVEFP
jgi:predicted lipoprotein